MFRRSFLQKSLVGLGAATFAGKKIIRSEIVSDFVSSKSAFMAECGVLGKDENYLIGFLMVINPQIHEDALTALREQLGYQSKLTYKSNDSYKLEFAKAAIDYFYNTSDLQLVLSREVLPANSSSNNYSLKQINSFKIEFTNAILTRYGISNTPDQVLSKYHSLNGPSIGFISEFENETNIPYQARVTHESNLLQLSSFLCGTITSIINKKVAQPIKIELNDYLIDKIGLSDFSIDQDTNKIKFYA